MNLIKFISVFFSPSQAEEQNNALTRKIKLLEEDLENAEDSATTANEQNKVLENEVEELKRENTKFRKEIETLEGNYIV